MIFLVLIHDSDKTTFRQDRCEMNRVELFQGVAFISGKHRTPITDDMINEIIDLCQPQDTKTWVSVKERLPESGQSLMFLNTLGIHFFGWCDDFNTMASNMRFFCDATQEIETGVTHWMPLPSPPVEDKP